MSEYSTRTSELRQSCQSRFNRTNKIEAHCSLNTSRQMHAQVFFPITKHEIKQQTKLPKTYLNLSPNLYGSKADVELLLSTAN